MNELLKNLGVIILLAGVCVLTIPYLSGATTNTLLLTGVLLVIGGFLGHIFMNKKVE